MSKHSGKIGLYLLLIVALIAGYLYLNDQVSTQGSYTMGQLEKALEEDKVTDAVIHQNREVPTGYVTANIVSRKRRRFLKNMISIRRSAMYPRTAP